MVRKSFVEQIDENVGGCNRIVHRMQQRTLNSESKIGADDMCIEYEMREREERKTRRNFPVEIGTVHCSS